MNGLKLPFQITEDEFLKIANERIKKFEGIDIIGLTDEEISEFLELRRNEAKYRQSSYKLGETRGSIIQIKTKGVYM